MCSACQALVPPDSSTTRKNDRTTLEVGSLLLCDVLRSRPRIFFAHSSNSIRHPEPLLCSLLHFDAPDPCISLLLYFFCLPCFGFGRFRPDALSFLFLRVTFLRFIIINRSASKTLIRMGQELKPVCCMVYMYISCSCCTTLGTDRQRRGPG